MNNPFEGKRITTAALWDEDVEFIQYYAEYMGGFFSHSYDRSIDYLVFDPENSFEADVLQSARDAATGGSSIEIISFADFQRLVYEYKMQKRKSEGKKDIDDKEFFGFSELTEVEIPEGATSIGEYAFYGCESLAAIHIPSSVTVIGEGAFEGCCSLKSIEIPDGVKDIPDNAFSLSQVMKHKDNYLRFGTKTCLLESLVLPESLKTIGEDAFNGLRALKELVIPEGVEAIGDEAFSFSGLKSVSIPSTVKTIGDGAFRGVEALTVYDNIKGDIGSLGGSGLKFGFTVTILSKQTGEVKAVVPMFCGDDYQLFRCLNDAWAEDKAEFDFDKLDSRFRKIKQPEIKRKIAEIRLKSPAGLPDEIQKMYAGYLKRSDSLNRKAVKNPNFVIKGKKVTAFTGDDTVTEIEIPKGITTIGLDAFRKPNNLRKIFIPEGVTEFERNTTYNYSWALKGCKDSLERISIPNSLKGMPDQLFDDLSKLSFNEYDNGLYVGNDANPYVALVRIKDSSVEKMTVPEGTRIINIRVLKECHALKELTLPESLIKIEDENQYAGNLANFYKKRSFKMNLPVNYLKTAEKLPGKLTYNFMSLLWKDSITVEDCLWVYLFQTGKSIDEFCEARIKRELNSSVEKMLSILEDHSKQAAYKKLVKLAFINKESIDHTLLKTVCEKAATAKVKSDELSLLSKYVSTQGETQDNNEADQLETYCLAHYDYKKVDETLRKCSISTYQAFKEHPVLYTESKDAASQFAVKCAIALYLDSVHGTNPRIEFNSEAEELIANFDLKSFNTFLRAIAGSAVGHVKMHNYNDFFGVEAVDRILPLVGRYADKELLDILFGGYDGREDYYFASAKPETARNYQRYLKGAILLNDSDEARDYCIERGWISEYAKIRGKKASDYRKNDVRELSAEEQMIEDAIAIYEKYVVELDSLLDGTYTEPIVEQVPEMSPIRPDNAMAKRFFAAIRDYYKSGERKAGFDYLYEPDELYDGWIRNSTIEYGHVGICLSVGLLVASYCFESKEISGSIVYSRSKWEFRRDCSAGTRLCLQVSNDLDQWKAFMAGGYPEYDM